MPIPLETMLDKVSPEIRREIDDHAQAIVADNRSRYKTRVGGARPTGLAEAAFSWSLRNTDRAAILADLNHRFDDAVRRHGRTRASLLYWLDTIRAIGALLIIRVGQGLAPSWLSQRLNESRTQRRP